MYIEEYLILDKYIEGEHTEADCCYYTWENLFNKYYANREFWKNTEFEKLEIYNNRKVIRYNKGEFYLSGDILFNFSSKEDGKKIAKYDKFYKILKDDPSFCELERSMHLEKLRLCNEMTYTLHNIGFMPVNGSLQTFKENIDGKLDRIDSFIYWINNYYINGENKDKIFEQVKVGGKCSEEEKVNKREAIRNKLEMFFEEFSNVIDKENAIYKYCEEMYLIYDEQFVKRLINSGKKR